jgi:hypothetical protein
MRNLIYARYRADLPKLTRAQPRNNRGSRKLSELPIGFQLLGKALDEARIFQIAYAYEQSTDWHKARPKLADYRKRRTLNAERPISNAE